MFRLTNLAGGRRRPAYRLTAPEMLESRALLADGISPAAGPALHAVAGVVLSDAVFATYTVTDPLSGPGDQWRALVNFGDGQVDGPLVPVPKGAEFAIVDSHTYKSPGTYTATVMIALPGSHQPNDNTVTTQVTVTAPGANLPSSPASPAAVGLMLRAKAHRRWRGPVARLSGVQNSAGPLTALISWGDESPPTPGRIRPRGHGRFQVIAAHSYALPGKYSVLVTIRDAAGDDLAANSTAIVKAHR